MNRIIILLLSLASVCLAETTEQVAMGTGGKELVFYQAKPMGSPVGGEEFKGSNFIHPLKTPSGFVVTDLQPGDHKHHFGLWWPWKHVQTGERKVLCWELQKGDGLIQAQSHESGPGWLTAKSDYIDRKAPGAAAVLLRETTKIKVSEVIESTVRGYFLDLEIIHRTAGDQPITVTPYRYSGFAYRGTPFWKNENSTVLTSEGMNRDKSNFTRARWVRVQGDTDQGGKAGVLLMSRPDNRDHPENLRTWSRGHEGAVFINFNTVMKKAWVFEPVKSYKRNYRLFVYDGSLSGDDAEVLWKGYASTVR